MEDDLNEYSIFEKFVNIVKRRRYREKQVSLTVSYFLKESVSIYYLRVPAEPHFDYFLCCCCYSDFVTGSVT